MRRDTLRAAAAEALPEGAFLRRDRGDALFVSDAPRLASVAALAGALAKAGFRCEASGGLIRLWPDALWLARMEAERPDPPDDLCAGLMRFRGLRPEAESLALFTLGARALDGADEAERFERALRRRAAECLRLNAMDPTPSPRGGGLYACALLAHDIKEE